MSRQWSHVLLYHSFLFIRTVIHTLRDVFWQLNGTTRHIREGKDIQVLNIRARYKMDTLNNTLDDFILTHCGFQSADYILEDDVSLYSVNEKQFVFVECPRLQSVWDMQCFSFSKEAQYVNASKLIIVPRKMAFHLAETIGKPQNNVIIIGNTSRCGSTLLCKMFQSTGHFISLCEPGAINDLLPFVGFERDENASKIIETTLTFLCKDSSAKGHCIKIAAVATSVISSVFDIFPNFHYLFMYRTHLSVLKSLARIEQASTPVRNRGTTKTKSGEYVIEQYENALQGLAPKTPYTNVIFKSLQPLVEYYNFLDKKMPIYGVRYEELIMDPEVALKKMFAMCDVPLAYVGKATRALDRDALEKSSLATNKISKFSIPEFTKTDKEQVEVACDILGLPNVLQREILPNTIT